ncbi:LysR family transcriptional regulator [Acidaminococcus sp. NSJ-142]|jgi:DNA-binding transcriptional LysR family regulator|uniref:LysR family transcriptional regulator n=1 Tax=Acidaminococcus TaxID=904 RepID=UPI001E3AC4FD|nr:MULTISPECIES: LysR family transcriptional regulator [Acidaminococcus]MCD2435842.1 LysR family transcriptional regulator [Acidaminococcus hominis]MCH4095633.1 LysR family transcriptional regulator [Acidaminococcus provencensis]
MELRVLHYFLMVAKEENISHAAELLHITQPTLSRQMSDLEEELGTPLLVRGKRKTTLTDAGQVLYKRAEQLISLAQHTKAELSHQGEIAAGDIYLGCAESKAMGLLAQAAKVLHDSYPGIHYHLYSAKADDVTERLDKGLLDFGLLIEPGSIRQYDSLELPIRDEWGVYMRKSSPLAQKAALKPQDLWQEPLFISRQTLDTHELYHWLQRSPDELNILGTYNLVYNASLMVSAGLGSALCLDQLIPTGPDSELCFRKLDPPLYARVYLVWKKEQLLSNAVKLYLAEVQKLVQA